MAKRLTKAQAKRRMFELMGKARLLFLDGYISDKDYTAIGKIMTLRERQLK